MTTFSHSSAPRAPGTDREPEPHTPTPEMNGLSEHAPVHQPPTAVEASPSTFGQRLERMMLNAAAPLNKYAVSNGSYSFLPASLDLECDKAAKILRDFCHDGAYEGNGSESSSFIKIPSSVIAHAVGLAIFTTGRIGCHWSGSTGSGVLVARLPDGTWSPPSGIHVRSIGTGFTFGVDVYDCACVINTPQALEIFTKTRFTLGTDVAIAAGHFGAGGAIGFKGSFPDPEDKDKAEAKVDRGTEETKEQEPHEKDSLIQQSQDSESQKGKKADRLMAPIYDSLKRPVYSYIRSRGFYAGFQAEGTAIIERKDANAAFYGQEVSVEQIIKGQVPTTDQSGSPRPWTIGANALLDTLRSAEKGRIALPEYEARALEGHGDDKLPQYTDEEATHSDVKEKSEK